jgi:putative lumazine-binding protein
LEQFLANVAKGATSGASRPKISVDFIDRAGNAAVVKLTELFDAATVTDYFSLVRSDTGWKL